MLDFNVLSKKAFRKALLAERGVTTATVAVMVPCSEEMVRRVFNGEFTTATNNINEIKRIAAEQADVTIEDLWTEGLGPPPPESDDTQRPSQPSGSHE